MVGRIEEDVNSILHICQDEYKQDTQRCQSCLHHCRHLGQDVLGHKLSLANNPQVRQTVYHFSVQAILKIKLEPLEEVTIQEPRVCFPYSLLTDSMYRL